MFRSLVRQQSRSARQFSSRPLESSDSCMSPISVSRSVTCYPRTTPLFSHWTLDGLRITISGAGGLVYQGLQWGRYATRAQLESRTYEARGTFNRCDSDLDRSSHRHSARYSGRGQKLLRVEQRYDSLADPFLDRGSDQRRRITAHPKRKGQLGLNFSGRL